MQKRKQENKKTKHKCKNEKKKTAQRTQITEKRKNNVNENGIRLNGYVGSREGRLLWSTNIKS